MQRDRAPPFLASKGLLMLTRQGTSLNNVTPKDDSLDSRNRLRVRTISCRLMRPLRIVSEDS